MRGYTPGRFSFNVKGGRCEACQGEGFIQIEMQFLPDVTVPCEVCKGKRYNREALEITLQGQEHRRGAGHDRRGGAGLLREHSPRSSNKLQTLQRRRPGLHPTWASRPPRSPAARRSG